MVTFFKDSLERKTSGLFLQRFCGSVLGQSNYDVYFYRRSQRAVPGGGTWSVHDLETISFNANPGFF